MVPVPRSASCSAQFRVPAIEDLRHGGGELGRAVDYESPGQFTDVAHVIAHPWETGGHRLDDHQR